MPSKDPTKFCHKYALKAIKDAHIRAGRNFRHSCNTGQGQLATPTPGARVNAVSYTHLTLPTKDGV